MITWITVRGKRIPIDDARKGVGGVVSGKAASGVSLTEGSAVSSSSQLRGLGSQPVTLSQDEYRRAHLEWLSGLGEKHKDNISKYTDTVLYRRVRDIQIGKRNREDDPEAGEILDSMEHVMATSPKKDQSINFRKELLSLPMAGE